MNKVLIFILAIIITPFMFIYVFGGGAFDIAHDEIKSKFNRRKQDEILKELKSIKEETK